MKDDKRGKKKEIASKKKMVTKKIATRKKRVVSATIADVVQSVDAPVEIPVEQLEQAVVQPQPQIDIPVDVPVPVDTPESPIYKRAVQLLLTTLIVGWIINFLFWKQSAGVNFAIAILAVMIGGIYWLSSNGLRPAWKSLWLSVPLFFFATVTFLRQEPLTIFLAFTFTLLATGLFASSYLDGRWPLYSLLDYFYKSLLLLGDAMFAPLAFFLKAQKLRDEPKVWTQKLPVLGVFRGLVLALPIVLCFGSLLASGDVVFRQKLSDFFDNFSMDKITENIVQGILILIYAYVLMGAFIHAALKSRDEKLVGEDKPFIKSFLGFPEAVVILGSVSILFLSFVVVQFQYFFGGQTNIGVTGYTYSEYARRGFNELIVVAFFSLVLILGLNTLTRRDTETQKRIYSSLSVAIVLLVMVILTSAYQRISLAIGWHGFSRLRLYPRIFLIWLGVLFVVVAVLEILRKERYFAFAAILASVGFAVTLTFVNVDSAIVKHNIPRVLLGKNLNVAHLASLSWDAVPALVDEYNSAAYPQAIHEGIGAILTCHLYYDSLPGAYSTDWRSFNLSRWQAHTALDGVEQSLQVYSIKLQGSHLQVRTPNKVQYECKDYQEEE